MRTAYSSNHEENEPDNLLVITITTVLQTNIDSLEELPHQNAKEPV